MPRLFRGRREIERKTIALADHKGQRKHSFVIPKGSVYEALLIRLSGTMTVGTAAASSVQAGGMERALRRAEFNSEFAGLENITGPLRAYTALGVNDAAGGRTASQAGRLLSFENRINRRTANQVEEAVVTQAANPVDYLWALDFARPNTPRGWQTSLDLRAKGDARLDVDIGVLETTAAGDDTDVLVTAATTTVTFSGYLDIVGIVVKNPPVGFVYNAWHSRPLEKALEVSGALKLALNAGRSYRRLYLLCADDDVPSDARINNLTVSQDDLLRPLDNDRWKALRGDAKGRYGIESLAAGFNVVEFDPDNAGQVLDTVGGSNADMYMNVPAGAASAADRLFVVTDEIIHPMRQTQVPGVSLFGRGRGRGRGR